MGNLFEIENLRCSYDKHFKEGVSKVVLDISKLSLPKGKKIFIVGESGIGKSTILELLGLMNNTIIQDDKTRFLFYDDGDKSVDLIQLWKRNNDRELSDFRRHHFNFIFQNTNLMSNFTAYENISITRMLQGYSQYSSFNKSSKVLSDLGMEHIDKKRLPIELSGGQQQRLAFARAIIPDFTVLFGDEPTGNLDPDNAVRAMELLTRKLEELKGSSAVIVSHDMHLAVTFADVIVKIKKKMHEQKEADDEKTFYGFCDEECVYYPGPEHKTWSNGIDKYGVNDFESYLRGS